MLTIVGLSVAVAVVVSLVGLSQSLESSFLALYTRRGADLVVQRRGGTVQLAKGLPLKLADRIEKMPGVKEVIRGLMDMVAFEKQGLFMVIVNGWEADCPVLDRVQITAGRRLQKGDRRRVMLGRILAANLGKRPGDSVELYSQQFEVVGDLRQLQRLRERGRVHAHGRIATADGSPRAGDRLCRPGHARRRCPGHRARPPRHRGPRSGDCRHALCGVRAVAEADAG